MEWKNWQNTLFDQRKSLPDYSGIYVVADVNDFVWYVGKAKNLNNRWLGKGHHRYAQLVRKNKKLKFKIYWKGVPIDKLDQEEEFYINQFKPELNGSKVKSYLPKKPQHEREIRRLLKTLNTPTLLFPKIRSVVAGEYIGEDGRKHILVLINMNDCQIISKSMRKRLASVKQAWDHVTTYCGRDEEYYKPCFLGIFNAYEYCFEFIVIPEVLNFLKDNPIIYDLYIDTVEVIGVKVTALKGLDFLDDLDLQEEYNFVNSDGTKTLRYIAYLNYRKRDINFLVEKRP